MTMRSPTRRSVAEVKAKMRIVEDAIEVLAPPRWRIDLWLLRLFAGWQAVRTLRLLAGAYADHPDYREEWKP